MNYTSALAAHNRLLAIDRELSTIGSPKTATRKATRAKLAALEAEKSTILADPSSYERQGYPFRISYGVASADRTRVLAYIDVL